MALIFRIALTFIFFDQAVLSQTDVCFWGRHGYNELLNGPYTTQGTYNDHTFYKKTWGPECDSMYIYWSNSWNEWQMDTTLGGMNGIYFHAFCNGTSVLTDCDPWIVWDSDSWEVDYATEITMGACPTLDCDSITVPGAPDNCGSFDNSVGNNVWKNSETGSDERWWYFDAYYGAWFCTGYAPNYSCSSSDLVWTYTEESWVDLTNGESTTVTLEWASSNPYTMNCVGSNSATTSYPTINPTENPTQITESTTTNPTQMATDSVNNRDTVANGESSPSFWAIFAVFLVLILICVVALLCIVRYKVKNDKVNVNNNSVEPTQTNAQMPNSDPDLHRVRIQSHSQEADKNKTNIEVEIGKVRDLPEIMEMRDQNTNSSEVNGLGMVASFSVDAPGISHSEEVIDEFKVKTGAFGEQGGDETCVLVETWLKETVKLPQYYGVFVSNGYDSLDIICAISDDSELTDLGIVLKGHIRKIMLEIKKLKSTGTVQD